jgi:NADH-quinone oxidoreductase subunit K
MVEVRRHTARSVSSVFDRWNPLERGTAAGSAGANRGKSQGYRSQPVRRFPITVRGDFATDTYRLDWGGDFRKERLMIPTTWYLSVGAVLFLIGVLGFFIKRNIIALLLSVEIMLNAVNLTFVAFSSQLGQISGQIFVFFVLVVAAAEAAVGLALVIAIFRNRESLNVDHSNLLRW